MVIIELKKIEHSNPPPFNEDLLLFDSTTGVKSIGRLKSIQEDGFIFNDSSSNFPRKKQDGFLEIFDAVLNNSKKYTHYSVVKIEIP